MKEISIHELDGFYIGNAEDQEGGTGCTVILSPDGATPGVDVRGGAPGTRETDLIASEEMVDKVHGLLLAGGSAFGLDAASGVMAYLEEKGIGFDTGFAKVPIVPGAVLYDLGYKDPKRRPDASMGLKAAMHAMDKNYKDGSFGAGTGATVGKILGPETSMKSGIGSFAVSLGDLKIGCIIAVNAFGSIYEGEKILAGPCQGDVLLHTDDLLFNGYAASFKGNTTIGCILTNAKLTKSQANKAASMAQDGMARAIRPIHTMVDGDTLFVLGNGEVSCDVTVLGTAAAHVVEKAIHQAVKSATCTILRSASSINSL